MYRDKSLLIPASKTLFAQVYYVYRLEVLGSLVGRYGLVGPVAANFFRNVYTPFVTDTFLCSLSRCAGTPFPTRLQGINTQDHCQPANSTTSDL